MKSKTRSMILADFGWIGEYVFADSVVPNPSALIKFTNGTNSLKNRVAKSELLRLLETSIWNSWAPASAWKAHEENLKRERRTRDRLKGLFDQQQGMEEKEKDEMKREGKSKK